MITRWVLLHHSLLVRWDMHVIGETVVWFFSIYIRKWLECPHTHYYSPRSWQVTLALQCWKLQVSNNSAHGARRLQLLVKVLMLRRVKEQVSRCYRNSWTCCSFQGFITYGQSWTVYSTVVATHDYIWIIILQESLANGEKQTLSTCRAVLPIPVSKFTMNNLVTSKFLAGRLTNWLVRR